MVEEVNQLTPEQTALRDKMVGWFNVTQELVLGKQTCERGWKDFSPSLAAGGCADYHAIFPLLDLLGMASSPYAHERFYKEAVRDYRPGEKRILVSGLATPSMAEIALEATGEETKIDVLDICATPLLTCQRVFQPEQLNRMKFTQADALTFTDGQYDLIVTDAFLTRFNDEQRLKVLKNWAKMLKPDGRVVTTWRIGDKQGEKGYGDKVDKRIFMENLEYRIKHWGIPMSTFLEMLTIFGLAKDYSEKIHSYSGQTLEEIKAFMEKCFGDVRISESDWVYDVTKRKYAQIVAYKPRQP